MHEGLVVKHGTRHAYSRYRCRCDDCVDAHRRYYTEFQRYRRDPDIDELGLKLPRIDGIPTGDWVRHAACKGLIDRMEIPNWWAPKRSSDRTAQVVEARRICFRCPVLDECRSWVLEHRNDPCPAHVVAAMTRRERSSERRRLGMKVSGRPQDQEGTAA